MTIPTFLILIEDAAKQPKAVYLWQDLKNGRDKADVLKEVEKMGEPAFYEFMKSQMQE